ncbi:TlpA family protein disulfide reductase [Thalassotalea crassostreae]|uniref:TlpA family protein disulfide reductase n=1 Tax=Thalassotalea crassostreae TaxID=1763536 RepID=UPI0009ED8564|nr:TlpA disulfide reductase family protein [Thalassotalea crassostreae]
MKSVVLQVLIVILVFNIVSMFRESSMLSSWTQESAPNFVLNNLEQKPISLLASDKKKIFYFFAPWCSICRVSITNLESLYQRNNNVEIVAIALDFVDQQEVEKFAEDLSLSFPIVLGNESVKSAYQVSAYPSYYVIDKDNTIEHRSMGYSTELGLLIRSL